MGHYRKTDPTTAISNLIKHALIVQRWADNEGSAEQRKIAHGWVRLITQYATKISPKFMGVPLSDQASYDANRALFLPADAKIAGTESFFAGMTPQDNPYPKTDPRHTEWIYAYNQAYLSTTNPKE